MILVLSLMLSACSISAPAEPAEPAPANIPAPAEEQGDSDTEQADSDQADTEQADTEQADDTESDQPSSPVAAPQPETPLAAPESPLPQADVAEMPALEIVYDEESGAISGQLTFIDENGERPVPSAILALGPMLKDDNGNPLIASYDAATAPKAVTDEYGRFVFNKVAPETYGLILDAGIAARLLEYPDSEFSVVFDVAANELVDLGELRYDDLPLTGYTKE